MPTTPKGFPYPASTDTPDVPRDVGALAAAVEALTPIVWTWRGNVSFNATGAAAISVPPWTGEDTARRSCAVDCAFTVGSPIIVGFGQITYPVITLVASRFASGAWGGYQGGLSDVHVTATRHLTGGP